MGKKRLILVLAAVGILMLVCAGAIYKYYAPSSVKREMSAQYKLEEGQYMLVVNNEVLEERGVASEGRPYFPISLATKYFNGRIFWDKYEKTLSYAMPTQVLTVGLNSPTFMLGKEQQSEEYNILVQQGNTIYIAMEFVKKYSAVNYEVYESPSRIVAVGDFTNEYTFGTLKKSKRLRVGPNKKYDYLLEIERDARVIIDENAEIENEYQKVMTEDGIVGYLPIDSFAKKEKNKWETDFVEPQFEHILLSGKIGMAWHQVTNVTTNSYLTNAISNTKGLNVISPTWLALSDNKGNFTSIASENYVQQAHNAGLQVWVLINDFDKKVNLERLLTKTSTRQQLVNNLVAKAIQYNVDGINIDFERITKKNADAFLEFLRELVIKCRGNQLVVSVDNYMPAAHNSHYNLAEQAKIVDYLVMMGYDEHYPGGGESGSVSSLSFVKEGTKSVLNVAPKEQVIMGLPFYTRLWKETPKSDGTVQISATAYGMDSAENVLKQNGAMAKWDETTSQYYSEFKSGKAVYKIWLEEEKSLEEKLKEVTSQQVAGVSFWKLGFERATAWDVIEKYTK